MHGGGAKKGGSGSEEVINNEPSKRGGAIGGKRGRKASGEQLPNPALSLLAVLPISAQHLFYLHQQQHHDVSLSLSIILPRHT